MEDVLDGYVDHITKSQNCSLLARIYGIFSICTKSFGSISVILMQNCANLADPTAMKYSFDLKGSYRHRLTQGANPSALELYHTKKEQMKAHNSLKTQAKEKRLRKLMDRSLPIYKKCLKDINYH